jgi:PAN domain
MESRSKLFRLVIMIFVMASPMSFVMSGIVQPVEYVWTKNAVSYNSSGRQLTGSVTATYYNAYLVTQCAFRCLQTTADQCASYNFIPTQRKCELNSASHVTDPTALVSVAESQYFLRNAFSIDNVSRFE